MKPAQNNRLAWAGAALVTRFASTWLAFLLAASFTQAATVTWLPTGGTNDWFGTNNWSTTNVPAAGDDVVITNSSGSTNWVLLTNSTAELASILLSNKCTLIFSNWDTKLSATNVDIMTNAVVTLPGAFTNTAGASNNIYIFCSNLTIGAGGSINANAAGFIGRPGPSSGYGPGGGYSWDGGGGYGGYGGGANGGTNYGDPAAPLQPGSAGGALTGVTGGSGGGAVRIQASGTVTLNGIITANGGSGANNYACGSGGAIYITCLSLAGTGGVLRANGGSGANASAGGGGGRIAVIYNTNAQASIPSVLFETRGEIGGYGDGYSGAGTLYFPNNLFLTETFQHSGNWTVPGFTNWSPGSLLISNGWLGLPAYGFQLTVSNNLTILGTNVYQHRLTLTNEAVLVTCGGNLFLTNAALELIDRRVPPRPSLQERIVSGPTLTVGGNLTLTNSAVIYVSCGATSGPPANSWGGLVTVTGDVFVATNAWVYLYSHPTNGGSPLIRLRNLTLRGTINANYAGFKGRPGPSRGYGPGGGNSYDGGGGYGGAGGGSTNAGVTYGDSNAPIQPGSAGGAYLSNVTGGNGGGAVRIQASATVTLNGTITANGGDGANNYACGSGGGIYITCRTLAGTGGVFRANGGSGSGASAGGGGGRIAVWRMYDVSAGAISNSVSRGTGSYGDGTNGTVVWGWIPVPGTVFTIH